MATGGPIVALAAGFDHGLLVGEGGKVAVFGPAHRPAGAAPGLFLAPVPFKVAVVQVAAGGSCRLWGWTSCG